MTSSPKLYIVGTPIGNLGDITFRAIETLKSVDVIFAEDTRVTKKLLMHFEIRKPVFSINEHTEKSGSQKVIERLKDGENVAYITDAGMPGISDPGAHIVHEVRKVFGSKSIEVIPGASALTAALSISGLEAVPFTFFGFPPHKKGRSKFLKTLFVHTCTSVIFESPHRLKKFLGEAVENNPKRELLVMRELTKIHESVLEDSAENLLEYFNKHGDEVRGEIVIIIPAFQLKKAKL